MQRTACVSILACLTLFGCASQPAAKRDPRDPFERMNRATYRFNDTLDRAIAKPVAKTYRKVTPRFVQTGVSNFMDNLSSPVTIINDLLQAKFKPACQDTGRLLLNTTLGLGGFFDPASSAGLDKHSQDFGLTFGKWGIPTGPYLVVPILGPSDVRDAVGAVGNEYANPRHYINDNTVYYSILGVNLVDRRARLLDAEKALEGVYDPYAFVRNAYLQRRQYLVTEGKSPDQTQEDQQLEEEKRILQETEGGSEPPPQPQPPQPKQP
jgi:phospholipid-binding lipoprotein MlaA